MRLIAAISLSLAASSAALAGVSGTAIPLTGLQIRNNTNQSRTSAPDTVGAAYLYNTDIIGNARGVGGVLGILFPQPTPIAQILAQLSGQPVTSLAGQVVNTPGTLPITGTPTTTSGTQVISGITVTYSFTLTTSIDAAGVASFSITSVVLSPSFLVGYLEFTSGNVVINRVCPGDTNADNLINFADLSAVLSQFGQTTLPGAALLSGDVNGDGAVNFGDLSIVLSVFGTGC